MTWLKKILEGVFSKAVYDFSKYLFFIFLSGISGIAAHIFAVNTEYLVPYAIVFSISIGALVGLLGFFLYRRFNPIFKVYMKTDFKFHVLKKELYYEYKDLNHMIYEKRLKLKVLCNNVDRYYDKYNWTGCGKPVVYSDDKDHTIVFTTKRDAFQQFEVHFGKSYKKGEIIDLHLIFELTDTGNKGIPMLSSTVVEPTEYLRLSVKVPKEFIKGFANAEIFPLVDSRIALEKYEKNFNNNGVIDWEIHEPMMLLVYSLRWELKKP